MPDARTVLSASLRRVASEGRLRRFVEAPSVSHEIVRRYVAGESVSSAVDVTADLLGKRRLVSLTAIQHHPQDEDAAKAVAKRYRKLLRRLGEAGLAADGRSEVSLGLASLGVRLGAYAPGSPDPEAVQLALGLARRICQSAANVGALVTIETDETDGIETGLDVVADLRQDFPGVGVSLEAALRRTEADVREQLGERVQLRKGGAGGPERFRTAAAVDQAYARSMRVLMAHPGGTPVFATRDDRLLEIAVALARHLDRAPGTYECQFRYGVRPELQAVVSDRGDKCRVYVPFGEDWYSYLIARVAQDPTGVGDLLKAAFAR